MCRPVRPDIFTVSIWLESERRKKNGRLKKKAASEKLEKNELLLFIIIYCWIKIHADKHNKNRPIIVGKDCLHVTFLHDKFISYTLKKMLFDIHLFFCKFESSVVFHIFFPPLSPPSPLSRSSAEPVFLVKLEGRPPVPSTEGSVTQPERSCIHMEWRVLIFQSHNRVNTALPFNKHHWQASMYCHWNDWTQLEGEGGGGGGVNVFLLICKLKF